MFIYCMPKYMAWSFHYNKKRWKSYKFVFLIDVAPLGITTWKLKIYDSFYDWFYNKGHIWLTTTKFN
jgi:hypothetical protein